MMDPIDILSRIRRPRLLVRAARFGLEEYNRSRDLRRLMQCSEAPTPERAFSRLIDEEARIEENRRKGDATYSISTHVDVLIALMAEANLLRRPAQNV